MLRRSQAKRRQSGNVLWGHAKDRTEAPSNPRADADVIKKHRKCGGHSGATCGAESRCALGP
ncbi:hypothetical protein HispidOSU_005709 [Sigmodon hispidus]